jgi:hypothetical protein
MNGLFRLSENIENWPTLTRHSTLQAVAMVMNHQIPEAAGRSMLAATEQMKREKEALAM